ncbi:MAG TPA: trypsin-like peptidase domain-containing protein [Anaerolineae bacterium]
MRMKLMLLVIALLIVAILFAGIEFVALPTARALVQTLPAQRLAEGLRGAAAATPAFPPAQNTASQPEAPAVPTSSLPANSREIAIPQSDNATSQLLEAIYAKVNPSVVQVTNLAALSSRRASGAAPQGEGSGFVWDVQGDIVTNQHVVSGADKIQVTFVDGTTVDATVVGSDPDSDIAVLKVDPKATNLIPLAQGDIRQVKVGELAVAIGNPFGFQGTMTSGIVSAIGRTIPSQTSFSIPAAVQTDAAINPGNSGGPLLNSRGQVIGVNDQIQSSSGSNSGIGFAIPINIVQRVVPSLIQNGSYQHAYLGISGGTYSRAWSRALGLQADVKGAYVLDVLPGGPAAKAGLQAGGRDTNVLLGTDSSGSPSYLKAGGDLITAIDDHPINKMDDLLIYLESEASPGQAVQLTILRDGGRQQTLRVILTARPSQSRG